MTKLLPHFLALPQTRYQPDLQLCLLLPKEQRAHITAQVIVSVSWMSHKTSASTDCNRWDTCGVISLCSCLSTSPGSSTIPHVAYAICCWVCSCHIQYLFCQHYVTAGSNITSGCNLPSQRSCCCPDTRRTSLVHALLYWYMRYFTGTCSAS